jgi:hypothetical protein
MPSIVHIRFGAAASESAPCLLRAFRGFGCAGPNGPFLRITRTRPQSAHEMRPYHKRVPRNESFEQERRPAVLRFGKGLAPARRQPATVASVDRTAVGLPGIGLGFAGLLTKIETGFRCPQFAPSLRACSAQDHAAACIGPEHPPRRCDLRRSLDANDCTMIPPWPLLAPHPVLCSLRRAGPIGPAHDQRILGRLYRAATHNSRAPRGGAILYRSGASPG